MAQKPLPDGKVLRQLLDYDPETGLLTWKRRSPDVCTATKTHSAEALAAQFNRRYAGRPALSTIDSVGYPSGRLFNSQVRAHRVIWKMFYGAEPTLIDHINKNKTDNRIKNLRSACKSVNGLNRLEPQNNTSGVRGVSWDQQRGRWVAYLRFKGKKIQKRFQCKNQAIKQRKSWERIYAEQWSEREREIEQVKK